MKAMILAAGVGSRLRPLTDTTPKALIEVNGVAMIELTARRLQAAKAVSLVVNVHHHADKVVAFCSSLSTKLGIPIAVSREDDLLLDTGGGLKKALSLLDASEPFLVHNVDVLSDLDLSALYAAHESSGALATLAVRRRPTTRPLRFSPDGKLLGRAPKGEKGLQFCGIYVLSPEIFELITETGVFSITDVFVRLASAGADIRSFPCDSAYWADIGDPEKLTLARKYAAAHPELTR